MSISRPDAHPSKPSGFAKSSESEMAPLDSPLSNRLMGSMSMVLMRRVPVWGTAASCELEPVRM